MIDAAPENYNDGFVRQQMQSIGHAVKEKLPEGWAFIVMACPMNDEGGRLNYVSNAERKNVVKMLKNIVKQLEQGIDYGTHSSTNDPV